MELVEVVLQGVRGVPGLVRWSFPPGVAVIPAGPADQLAARAAFELLAGVQEGVIAGAAEAGQGRAAVVIVGRDQRRYRLLWELSSGRRALQVMNGTTLEVLTTSQAEIIQMLTAQVGFPQSDVLRELCFGFTEDLPSKRTKDASASGPHRAADRPAPPGFDDLGAGQRDADKPLPPGFDGAGPTSRFLGRPEAELRARLADLRSRVAAVPDVRALEFELDGLQKKAFELQSRRRPLVEIDNNVATLDGQLARSNNLASLPDDFGERASHLLRLRLEHDRQLDRLDVESRALIESVDHLTDEVSGVRQRGGARPLQAAVRDPLVRGGVVAGLAAIVVAIAGGLVMEGLRYVALLDIPAFGVAVWGGLKLLGGMEEGATARLKLARLAAERKRLQDAFAIDREQLERILERHKLIFSQLPEVLETFTLRQELLARRRALLEQRAPLAAMVSEIEAEEATNAVRIKELEEQLQVVGAGYDPQAADLAREADEIERVLRGEFKAPAAPPPSPVAAAPTSQPPSGAVGVDVPLIMIRLASDLLVKSVDDAATLLGPRAGQLLQAFSDGRLTALVASSRGTSVVRGGAAVPFGELDAGDRDLTALALRCAIVEAVTPVVGRLPVMFERSLDHLPVEKAPLVVKAMQLMGALTQVMCFTQRRELAGAGTVVQGQAAQAPT